MALSATVRGVRAHAQNLRRESIIRAAAQVFMDRGYTATTMDDVAAVMGATKGRIYHYYRSKVALFSDVHELALITISARVKSAFGSALPPDQKFHRMCIEHLRTMIDEFALCRVGSVHGLDRHIMENASAQQARMLRKIVRLRDTFEQMFLQVIVDGIASGHFKRVPPRVAVKAALGALNWFGVWYDPTKKTPAAELDEIVETLAIHATDGLRVRACES
jgi:AcrR family transcriptional regulator